MSVGKDFLHFRALLCADLPLDEFLPLEDIKYDHTRRSAMAGQNVYIWSGEYHSWWRPDGAGYTMCRNQAGIYTLEDALRRSEHCDPSKKVRYVIAPSLTSDDALDEIAHILGTHRFGSTEGWGKIQAVILRYHNQQYSW